MPTLNPHPKVLIVEDEAITARDIEMQLTGFGFQVVGKSTTAAEAFHAIESAAPDLVLMDITIKGELDGISAAEIVRNRYALPVIYLTAHTDKATLERAGRTDPFGYIVKPLGNINMKPLILMALNKHRTERELEDHQQMLSAILQGLPDAVLVTGPPGEILFLNRAAEQLTGWTQEEAAGKNLVEVAPLENDEGQIISMQLVQNALRKSEKLRVPVGSALVTRDHRTIEVAGQLSVTRGANQRPAGVFVTLQDVTVQRREEQCLRQENQMLVAGELARGVAHEFYALSNMMQESARAVAGGQGVSELDLVRQAGQIGKDMALLLLDLREAHGASYALNVGHYLAGSTSLLERFCGLGVSLDISPGRGIGYVVSTGNHFEQLLTHLCLNGRHFLGGRGRITIIATSHQEPFTPSRTRSYVRLAFLSEKSVVPDIQSEENLLLPFGGQFPDVNLSIVRAIAIASEGFSRTTEMSDSSSLVEVFLPRHASRENAIAATNEHTRVLLLIGLPPETVEAVKLGTGDDVALLEAANVEEACLISELYPGDFDLIVVNEPAALAAGRERIYERIRARRPAAGFLQVGTSGEWPAVKPIDSEDVTERVAGFFHKRALYAATS